MASVAAVAVADSEVVIVDSVVAQNVDVEVRDLCGRKPLISAAPSRRRQLPATKEMVLPDAWNRKPAWRSDS